jgi:hypothetical protein
VVAYAIVAALTATLALASLLGSLNTWRRLQTGRAKYEDLFDYTGIFDRALLRRTLAARETEDGALTFDPRRVAGLPRAPYARWLDTPTGDFLSVNATLLAVGYALVTDSLLWPLLGLAFGYEALGWIVGAWRTIQASPWEE